MTRQVVIDTETTGASTMDGDRVVSVGLVELVDGKITGARDEWFFNPGRKCHPDAVRVHGLTDEFLAQYPPFRAAARLMDQFIDGCELIAHNAPFDRKFWNNEIRLLKEWNFTGRGGWLPEYYPDDRWICSMSLFRKQVKGKKYGLDACCDHFKIDRTHRRYHGALMDADLCAKVYQALLHTEEPDLSLPFPPDKQPIFETAEGPRPPYRSRLTDAERKRHTAFVGDLGAKPIWGDYVSKRRK